jgi:hypothetical protein
MMAFVIRRCEGDASENKICSEKCPDCRNASIVCHRLASGAAGEAKIILPYKVIRANVYVPVLNLIFVGSYRGFVAIFILAEEPSANGAAVKVKIMLIAPAKSRTG